MHKLTKTFATTLSPRRARVFKGIVKSCLAFGLVGFFPGAQSAFALGSYNPIPAKDLESRFDGGKGEMVVRFMLTTLRAP